jgi:hypothetical protein
MPDRIASPQPIPPRLVRLDDRDRLGGKVAAFAGD